jgi:hypothetical protein
MLLISKFIFSFRYLSWCWIKGLNFSLTSYFASDIYLNCSSISFFIVFASVLASQVTFLSYFFQSSYRSTALSSSFFLLYYWFYYTRYAKLGSAFGVYLFFLLIVNVFSSVTLFRGVNTSVTLLTLGKWLGVTGSTTTR